MNKKLYRGYKQNKDKDASWTPPYESTSNLGVPGADPEHTGGLMYAIWPGNALEYRRRRKRK